jgi:poly-gamma-glutamate synthesis protein (capsule biosynthesis protein)
MKLPNLLNKIYINFKKASSIGLLLFLIIFNDSFFASERNNKKPENRLNQNDSIISIKLVFTGDIMQHLPQVISAYDSINRNYNYYKCFQFIKPILENSDFAVGNFETTLAGKPYNGYPQFSSPDELLKTLKDVGFKLLLTANNHCLDRGKIGLERTISLMDGLKIQHSGTFKDSSSRSKIYPIMLTIKGIKIALFNYTYATNNISPTFPNIVNYIDTNQISKDIEKARKAKPDFMIMTIHWGEEYKLEPNSSQRRIAMFCFRKGIDLIIG